MRDGNYYTKIKLNKKQENEEKKALDSIKECGDHIKLYKYSIDRVLDIRVDEITATVSEINKTKSRDAFRFDIGNFGSDVNKDELNCIYYCYEAPSSYKKATNISLPTYFELYSTVNSKKIKEEFVNIAYKLLNETRDSINNAINESYNLLDSVEDRIRILLEKKKAKK